MQSDLWDVLAVWGVFWRRGAEGAKIGWGLLAFTMVWGVFAAILALVLHLNVKALIRTSAFTP